jgi:hypothetical protein
MKKVLLLAVLSSFIFADGMMGGWNNSEDEAAAKAQKEEQVRMCTLYTKKIEKYKETMRDDELAQATLNNYVRLQTKYCDAAKE